MEDALGWTMEGKTTYKDELERVLIEAIDPD
jgi:hypothetical protein